jgi:hypothetical protein
MTRKSSNVVELEPVAAAPNGTHGYRPRLRTRRIIGDREHWPEDYEKFICPIWPEEGAEPFWADVRANLTFDDIDSIPNSSPFPELQELLSPWVVAWNAGVWNQESNIWQPTPPPAEAGPAAFRTQPREVTLFILNCLKYNIGTNLPKGSTTTADTDGG